MDVQMEKNVFSLVILLKFLLKALAKYDLFTDWYLLLSERIRILLLV